MNPLKILLYRFVQCSLRIGAYFFSWKPPKLISGPGVIKEIPLVLKNEGFKKPLIVTDANLLKLGLLDSLLETLEKQGIVYVLYDKVQPNPTVQNAEEAAAMFKNEGCDCFIAFGGGSPMDCAKTAGVRLVRPRTSLSFLQGFFKVVRKVPAIFAVPTTAGTGSEATIAAVVSNPDTHEKYAISDPALRPRFAILDPLVTVGLPKHITSTTGMDALTHAVEAFIGRSNTRHTKKDALKACKLIFENLPTAYEDGQNLEARTNMLLASHYAGLAFTRAYVGYVHAIAHKLGGFYGVPHGLANAVILPYVLDYYGNKIYKQLAQLADAAGIKADDESEKAKAFINAIKDLNDSMQIPKTIRELREEDIPKLAKMAMKEGNPFYPVPVIMSRQDCEELLKKLLDK